ncbi:hypothetical protein [Methylophaga sp.]|uniref:hypothetical protein n=1 Tax=Methylophaga sp. TaxID=2024840 RepID=UPI003A8F9DBF
MATDQKHLRKRGNVWWLHYRIPEEYKLLPECIKYKAIVTKSLKTDSLTQARKIRDAFLRRLDAQVDDHYKAWLDYEHEPVQIRQTVNANQGLSPFTISVPERDPAVDTVRRLMEKGSSIINNSNDFNKFKSVAMREQDAAMAMLGAKRVSGSSLRHLLKMVIREYELREKASKTITKIKRGVDWFLERCIQDDIDIEKIDYEQVREFVNQALEDGEAGSTIKGHLYGPRQVWKRAKQSRIVTGDNPFEGHYVPLNTISYSPFSYDEVYQLYANAEGELKTLIHVAATTGARVDELLTAEVRTPTGYNHPCWLIKFKQKGKTEQSTRVVPLHDSLNIDESFQFKSKYSTMRRKLKALVLDVLGEPINELTGKPRVLTIHSFRATVITQLAVKNRIHEKVVGTVTGHLGGGSSRAGAIRSYIHVDDLNDKKDIVDLLPWEPESL